MIAQTISELNEIRDKCYSMVTNRSTISAASSAVPIPGTDIATDIAILLEMLPAINKCFGLGPEQIEGMDNNSKAIIYSLIKKAGTTAIGSIITKEIIMVLLKRVGARVAAKQILKFIPFLGTIASASIGFGAMKYVGNNHVDECYNIALNYLKEKGIIKN